MVLLLIIIPSFLYSEKLTNAETEWLANHGTVTVVSQISYPPFEFRSDEGQSLGMSIELLQWIATEYGIVMHFTHAPFKEAQEMVLSGEADILSSFFYSKERDRKFDFSSVIYKVPASIFVRRDRTDIHSISDLKNQTVSLQSGDYAIDFLTEKKLNISFLEAPDFDQATTLLIENKSDALVGDTQIIMYHVYQRDRQNFIKRIGTPLYEGKNCFAVKQGNTILRDILNHGLKKAESEKILQKIERKWLGQVYAKSSPLYTYRFFLVGIIASLFLFALTIWFWNNRLRKEVNRRVEELRVVNHSLMESQERFHLISNNTSDIIVMVEKTGKIIFINHSVKDIFGFSEKDILNTNILDHFDTANPSAKTINTILSSVQDGSIPPGSQRQFEIEMKDSHNTTHHLVSTTNVAATHKNDIYIISIVKDVTESLKLQEEQLKARKLESVGVLAGGIAHDFNNLLTGIIGNISLAQHTTSDPDTLRRTIRDAATAAQRAKDLTQQLLTFSKGSAPLKELTDIQSLIQYEATFALRGSNVKLDIQSDPDLRDCEVDSAKISQVINNLVINADQAMPKGGLLKITISNHSIEVYDVLPLTTGDYVHVVIQDEGKGIDRELQQHIFDPYFTTKSTGSGLGLATSYSIVLKHNGYMYVESEVDKGTRMHILLPASDERADRSGRSDSVASNGFGSILVMDDDDLVLRVAEGILSSLGYTVFTAENGTETLQIYREQLDAGTPFRAVIMDLTIPGGMGGEEAIGQLLKIDPDATAIVSSGYADDPILTGYTKYGFKAILRKPYTLEEMSSVLNSLFDGNNDK